MLLTGVAIVGGALITGSVKLYRENKRKQEIPWTVYAERLAKKSKEKKSHPTFLMLSGIAALQKLKPESITPFLTGLRSQQLKELTVASDKEDIGDVKKKEQRHFMLSLSSLLFATAGALVYSPLSWLSIPGIIYISRDVYESAYTSLVKEHHVTIDLLDAITNTFLVIGGYYFLCNALLFYYVIRKKLLATIKGNSSQSLIDVFRQQPRFVWILKDGVEVELPFETLKGGDVVVVRAAQPIPVDGVIISGMALVDQHILTGESQPVDKGVGEQVFALTVVLSGRICVQVEKTGQDTTAAQIGRLLNQTVEFKTKLKDLLTVLRPQLMLPCTVFHQRD